MGMTIKNIGFFCALVALFGRDLGYLAFMVVILQEILHSPHTAVKS
jgi:hypothetical protein